MKIAFFGTGEFSTNVLDNFLRLDCEEIMKILGKNDKIIQSEDFVKNITNEGIMKKEGRMCEANMKNVGSKYEDYVNLKFCVSQPDKKVGRKQILTETELKKYCKENNIPIFQPEKLKSSNLEEKLKDLDFAIVVAYGKIIPESFLNLPKYGFINVHGSILPKYRGASPIQESIKNGDKETGVTIMQMSKGMDEGNIFTIEKIKILEDDTSEDLFKKFEEISPKILCEVLVKIMGNKIQSIPQNHKEATYCSKIEKEDGFVNFKAETAQNIYNKFRAFSIWPGIWTNYKGQKLSLEKIELGRNYEAIVNIEGRNCEESIIPGKVFKNSNKEISVGCKNGYIILKQVKKSGRNCVDIVNFINGEKDFIGFVFE